MLVIISRSREGAWIEMSYAYVWYTRYDCRSREGAWIEICKRENGRYDDAVAPVRERGLKY